MLALRITESPEEIAPLLSPGGFALSDWPWHRARMLVAVDDGQILGGCLLMERGLRGEPEVHCIIAPRFRGIAILRRLLGEFAGWIHANSGWQQVWTFVDRATMIPFLRPLGFEERATDELGTWFVAPVGKREVL